MNPLTQSLLDSLAEQALTPLPLQARLSIDATAATPYLAAAIGRILASAGVSITFDDERAKGDFDKIGENPPLKGLHVHIGQLTWVRHEEATRWGK